MPHFKRLTAMFTAALLATVTPAMAEKLTGSEVVALMSQGQISFRAGSVWSTQPGNRYSFTHRNSSESGSFKVFSNGNVEIFDEGSGQTIRFYFDRGADGVPALIYTTGAGAGKRYPIK